MTIRWVITRLVATVLPGTACGSSKKLPVAGQSPTGLQYYFSCSTGDTRFLYNDIGGNTGGPFTYAGRIPEPAVSRTSQLSISEIKRKTYLFYHDCSLPNAVTHLRCLKMTELADDEKGFFKISKPY